MTRDPRMILRTLRQPHLAVPGAAFTLAALVFSGPLAPVRGGDILRGGAPMGNPTQRAAAAQRSTAAAAAAARANARDNLARTTQAIQSVRAMQLKAASVARGNNAGLNPNLPGTRLPNVPNGLAAGGLEVDPGVAGGTAVWSGATLPTQSRTQGRTTVNIRQTRQTALLDWKTYNVGRQTTLRYNQSAAKGDVKKWIAFNRVNDPSAAPSQILGSIVAPGQVYVINRNGILFGAGSQVNTGTLVASSLPINPNLIERGLLNNPDAQFLFSGIDIPAGAQGTPGFTPDPANPAIGRYGDVIVQPGAVIKAPTDSANSGGRVMLVGPNVRQAGSILTPDGQTILAAGMQVGIAAHPSSDPSLRGLDVYVGSVTPAGGGAEAGLVDQSGLVSAPRGNITLAGREIRHSGALESTTSVSLNGRIDIQASYDAITNTAYNPSNAVVGAPFLQRKSGTVRIGSGAVVRILPELRSRESVIGQELALRSQVNVTGRAIHLGRNAAIQAPSGEITIEAGEWRILDPGGANPNARLIRSVGQVYLDRGSLIDVAGVTAVPVAITKFLLKLELRGAELANSPLQRESFLRNRTILVDLRNAGTYGDFAWIGTPLADATGFAGLVQRTVGEFSAKGGDVTIGAGESFVMNGGARIDASGGFIRYEAGKVKTTRLRLGQRLVDISDATPDRLYEGIYTGRFSTRSERWGVTRTWDQALALTGERYEPSYEHGAAAGTIDISSPSMALDGELRGRVLNGPRQRETPAEAGSLRLAFLSQDTAFNTFPEFSPTPPSVSFEAGVTVSAAAPFSVDAAGDPAALRADRRARVVLSPTLLQDGGFGSLAIENPDGAVSVPDEVRLKTPAGGSLALEGSRLDIQGSLIAPGGTIDLTAHNVGSAALNLATFSRVSPAFAPGRGTFTLGAGARLSTAGQVVDERGGVGSYAAIATGGGEITIRAYSATLEENSVVTVAGGARIGATGRISHGDAGSLVIDAGQDPEIKEIFGGVLSLGGRLSGISGAHGGSLDLSAPAFQIGGSSGDRRVAVLDPGFFSRGGFASFALTATGLPGAVPGDDLPGVSVVPGTRLRPVVSSRVTLANAAGGTFRHRSFARPVGLRDAASLSFRATGLTDSFNAGLPITRGDTVLGAGASIVTDPGGSVSLRGETVAVLGSVIAPGGTIRVTGADSFPLSTEPLATVYIGNGVRLSTAGRAVIRRGLNGWREGTIHDGGTIELFGNLVAERGAVLDVSGTRGVLDLPPTYLSVNAFPQSGFAGQRRVPVRDHSDGGLIQLTGSEMLYSDAALVGRPGGHSARGGSLEIASDRYVQAGVAFTTADANLVVRDRGNVLPVSAFARGVGRNLRDASGTALPGIGNFAADRFERGGFASLSLAGNVRFAGDVDLAAPSSLRVADGGVIYADGSVRLRARHVALGREFRTPFLDTQTELLFLQTDASGIVTPYFFPPDHGGGRLTVSADLIEIGDLSLHGIGRTDLLAARGDIRGNGTFQMAGDLVARAGQVYTTTLSEFKIFVYDPAGGSGSATFLKGANRPAPLSAGGHLAVYASEIFQGGVLRAPIGSLLLGRDASSAEPANRLAGTSIAAPVTDRLILGSGSVTSVAAIDPGSGRRLVIPFGVSFDGNAWIDPAGNDITVGGVPAKEVLLSAANLETRAGSLVDLRGGGDLYAYRWIFGNGGTRDILDSDSVFAVIPGFDLPYAPYAPFNSNAAAVNLQGERGYVNDSLRAGDRVTLGASRGLAAGTYTLLPARYALLPGAFLLTPQAGAPVGSRRLEDGSSLVSGYLGNHLDGGRYGRTEMRRFEVAPGSVVRQRAEYADFSANAFLRRAAASREIEVPRLPVDAGSLGLNASASMSLAGSIATAHSRMGRGSLVDLESPLDILVNRTGTGGGPGQLVLSVAQLNRINAESLLIGGRRSLDAEGAFVTAKTGNITIDTGGAVLTGSDLLFTALGALSVRDGSVIRGVGNNAAEPVRLGIDATPGSGDGALLRVSGSRNAPVTRFGIGNSTAPTLAIGNGAVIRGGAVTADSTFATDLDPGARLLAPSLSLHSGQISIPLDNPGALNPTDGLVLTGGALQAIEATTRSLTLLSYSAIDLYGTGTVGSGRLQSLTLRAGSIRGFNQGGGDFGFAAGSVLLENSTGRSVPALPAAPLDGRLRIDAGTVTFGRNDLGAERFATVSVGAADRILVSGTGSFSTAGDLDLVTPLLTGAGAARHRLAATGDLSLTRPAGAGAGTAGGLGARLELVGASVSLDGNATFQSGEFIARATAGDLTVGTLAPATIDVSGVSRRFLDVIRHTGGGTVSLASDAGSINLSVGALVDVSAPSGGGSAGLLGVSAPAGSVDLDGTVRGTAGTGGRGGSFSLDAAAVVGGDLAATDAILNAGGFDESRTYRLRSGDLAIGGTAASREYRVSVDDGSLFVSGTIDASGTTGGTIELSAHRDLVLLPGSLLDASAAQFSAAGKGGHVFLGAGASRDGVIDPTAELDLRSGSTIDLSVAAALPASPSRGQFTGTLHLRAPVNGAATDVRVAEIGSTITGASAVVVEGYRLFDRSATGTLDNALLALVQSSGNAFLGSAGAASGSYGAMVSRLTSLQPGLDLIMTFGAEIQNRSGSLVLGSDTSTEADDWNLAPLRFGPDSAAGFLTLRARDNIDLYNALSDGFNGGPSLWLAPLVAHNPLLPANSQSWSYTLAAGADFSAADPGTVRPLETLGASEGMIRLGKNAAAATVGGGSTAQTSTAIANRFQVIRTGSGFIDIHAGRTFQFLNPFATVYTAGTQVADPTGIFAPGDFVTPILNASISNGSLGSPQQTYGAQYAIAGGHVSIRAGENIERKTRNNSGLIDDSSRQLPNNWLYRRGHVGPNGQYGQVQVGFGFITLNDPAASTSWWVDYSNFFQGVGALGGSDVSLVAGSEVRNVDAVIPTTARAARGIPGAATLVETGGGDLLVRSGGDISGGVYYVERGVGRLEAGGSITTNATRSPSRGLTGDFNNPASAQLDPLTWMPTALFLGRSSFDVSARGDVLLGPMANPFLLPQGLNNRFWYKTYFSTYGADSAVRATSLGGDVTLRNSVTLPTRALPTDTLSAWIETQHLLTGTAGVQPWLRLAETLISPFAATMRLAPPTVEATSLAGDINLAGPATLYPAPRGQLELIAAGQIHAFQPTGVSNQLIPGQSVRAWASATLNVSDADPGAVPGVTNPFSYFSISGSGTNANNTTRSGFYDPIGRLFTDSSSTAGTFAATTTKQALHDSGLLHRGDSEPLRVYALGGNLSGLTLFSHKESRIFASRDISDISLYLQNLGTGDNTIVSAGRDLIAYSATNTLRNEAFSSGNFPAFGQGALPGDIHLGGPGTLQVLAGRNLDLGVGPTNADGSGTGILTIGNNRNPFLPFAGADLLASAGLGPANSFAGSQAAFERFIAAFVKTKEGAAHLRSLGIRDFDALDDEARAMAALDVFYLVLRDTGRDFNDPGSDGFGNYNQGFAAIRSLFGTGRYDGDILAQARNIRTQSGGNISLLAPGGGLSLANTLIGNPLVPPGIVTETGGTVSIFTRDSVDIGVGRIFTLRGGDMVIWSSRGDIAAGVASKTVASAPPTRVLIDPQSATVETDLAGLATGGGIGVLATVAGVKPGNVDLIAPAGIIDAGDAGIRVTGDINLAATQVVNASNIAVGGSASGAPAAPAVSSPNVGGLSSASNTAGAASTAAMDATDAAREQAASGEGLAQEDLTPSVITVEVLGYGGGGAEEDEDEE